MSIRWMTQVWDESPYEGTRLLIHLGMADHANDEGKFFIAQSTLATKARCTVEYVRKTVKQMVADNVLVIEKRGSSKGRATEYRLLPNSVWVTGDADPQTLFQAPPNSEALTPQLHTVTTTILNHPDTTIDEADAIAKAAASFWWEAQEPKPIGKSAWFVLVKVCKAAADRGYSEQQIAQALFKLNCVPSLQQMDKQLRNVQPMSARQQRLQRGLEQINVTPNVWEIAQ